MFGKDFSFNFLVNLFTLQLVKLKPFFFFFLIIRKCAYLKNGYHSVLDQNLKFLIKKNKT